MSKQLGNELPPQFKARLEEGTRDLVVPLLSVDDRGLPHPALLSLYELVISGGELYFFLSERSRSSANLRRRRVVTLLFVEPTGCFYLKGYAVWAGNHAGLSIFRLDLTAVLQDFPTPEEGTAFLVSSARFQADEESLEQRLEIREQVERFLAG